MRVARARLLFKVPAFLVKRESQVHCYRALPDSTCERSELKGHRGTRTRTVVTPSHSGTGNFYGLCRRRRPRYSSTSCRAFQVHITSPHCPPLRQISMSLGQSIHTRIPWNYAQSCRPRFLTLFKESGICGMGRGGLVAEVCWRTAPKLGNATSSVLAC